jgi:NAD(P)-dependent dehydrogenase (short-subunit alcohol dehydrogenase family)
VTGAAQGIGLRYAEFLAREGAKVVVVDIKADAAEEAAAAISATGTEALALVVDVSNAAATKEMARRTAAHFGGIDILVNNAAIYEGYVHYNLMELPLDYWQRFLDVNLTGVLLCTQAVVPYMKERGSGKIVNQSSAGAATAGSHYGLTKLGVQGLTVGLAGSLGKFRINVNCIAPGITDTSATRGHYSDEQLTQMVATRVPIGVLATVDDMAHALIYLVSDEARMVTGTVLHVDGGMVRHPA